jgi:dethiobiotin synthetase
MPAIFVTGTDTGVGKTVATAALALALRETGVDVGVMKPIETAAVQREGRRVGEDAALLQRLIAPGDPMEDLNPVALELAAAPSAAAKHAGLVIDLSRIKEAYARLAGRHEVMLVEGVGGLLVPIDATTTMADLSLALEAPLVVVARQRLGTLNHTLLTLREAERLGCRVLGVILNAWDRAGAPLSEDDAWNLKDLRERLSVPVLAELPACDLGPQARWTRDALAPLVRSFLERGALEIVRGARPPR